jgi:hypothetical protein
MILSLSFFLSFFLVYFCFSRTGKMDDMRVYNVTLTAYDVFVMFKYGTPITTKASDCLVYLPDGKQAGQICSTAAISSSASFPYVSNDGASFCTFPPCRLLLFLFHPLTFSSFLFLLLLLLPFLPFSSISVLCRRDAHIDLDSVAYGYLRTAAAFTLTSSSGKFRINEGTTLAFWVRPTWSGSGAFLAVGNSNPLSGNEDLVIGYEAGSSGNLFVGTLAALPLLLSMC